MKRFTLYRLLCGLFLPLVSGAQPLTPPPLSYAVVGQVYRQDFDGLPAAGTIPFSSGKGPFALAADPVKAAGTDGWFIIQTGGSSANAQLLTGTGSGTASGAYSFGAAKNNNRSLGALASGSGVYAFGLVLNNHTGVTLDSCTLSFTVEQWRKGGSGQRNTYTFSYATGNLSRPLSSNLTGVPALNLQSIVYTIGASALNGKLPANQYLVRHTIRNIRWKPGEQLLLRWDDHDEPGSDDALAIDDFSFSASNITPVDTVPPRIDSVAPVFVNGAAVTLPLCKDATALSLSASLGVTNQELGETLVWSLVSPPSFGSIVGLPISKTSTKGIVFPTSVIYTPGNISSIVDDAFTVQISDGVNKAVIQVALVVSPVGENSIANNQWICTGSKPATLTGSIVLSEKFPVAYTWEYSIVAATNGFQSAPGVNHLPDYMPPIIETNTWFRRKQTIGTCSSYTSAVFIMAMKTGLWLGNVNRDWHNANNWCGDDIPAITTDVFIQSSSPHFPHITTMASCNRLSLTAKSSLQISGILQCGGNIDGGAESIDATKGSIEMSGLQPQEVPSSVLLHRTVHDLIINNNNVYLKDSLSISGVLSCRKGVFETNGLLLLREDGRIGPAAIESNINGNVQIAYRLPRDGVHLLAHPFSEALDTKLLTQNAGGSSLSFFDENAGYLSFDKAAAWTAFDSSGNMPKRKWDKHQGLRIQIKDSLPSSVILLSGRVNQGSQEIFFPPDQYTGYRLAVNPYPCPVNMLHNLQSKHIAPYFWIWDNNQGLHGGYTSIPFKSHFMMPAFASFFIKTYAFTENHLLFTEQAKLTGELPDGFMELTDDPYHLELRLESDSLFWDRILLFHIDSARDAIDPLDAEKIMNPDVNFYSFSSDKNALSADAQPFHKKTVIPLGIRSNVSGLFRIRVARKYLPEKLVLYLHDKLLGRWMQLEKDSSYYFRLTRDTLNLQTDRFEITAFKKEPVIITIPSKIRLLARPVPANDQLVVDFKAMQPGNCSLQLFSLQGQRIRSYRLGIRQEGRFTISLAGIPWGVYILELQCADNAVVQRIIVGAG